MRMQTIPVSDMNSMLSNKRMVCREYNTTLWERPKHEGHSALPRGNQPSQRSSPSMRALYLGRRGSGTWLEGWSYGIVGSVSR
jgi:hypothetical protein